MPAYIDLEFQKLVKVRLQALPENTSLSIGYLGSFSKQELLEHVDKNDDIGKQMIEIDKMYLQALKEGTLFER
jgi:hypothetical protein